MAKNLDAQRRDAAEEVCYTLLMMMAFGNLELPQRDRDMLAKAYEPWMDLAVRTGKIRGDDDEATLGA